MEGNSQRQERTIARQASEIEGLKATKKKREDELQRSNEGNEAQRRELAQLKDENKAMKAKEDRLLEEVGKLKEEIQRMAAKQDQLVKELAEINALLNELNKKRFPPSVKKGNLHYDDGRPTREVCDIPDWIIAHLRRGCGGDVHDRHVVDVTSGSWNSDLGVERDSERLRPEAAGLKVRVEVLEHDNGRLSEAKELEPQSQEARGLSNDLVGLITVVGLRGGSMLPGGLSARGWRMLPFEIGPTISRLSLAIITIGVRHLLRSSCHLGFPNLVALMQRSTG
jgi:flagellar biosynthesis GTPase FlhF